MIFWLIRVNISQFLLPLPLFFYPFSNSFQAQNHQPNMPIVVCTNFEFSNNQTQTTLGIEKWSIFCSVCRNPIIVHNQVINILNYYSNACNSHLNGFTRRQIIKKYRCGTQFSVFYEAFMPHHKKIMIKKEKRAIRSETNTLVNSPESIAMII